VRDEFPTIAQLLDVETTELLSHLSTTVPLALDGVSFLSAWSEPTTSAGLRETMYSEEFSPGGNNYGIEDTVTVRNADYQLIYDELNDVPIAFFKYEADGSQSEPDGGNMPPSVPPADQADLDAYDDLLAERVAIGAGLVYDSAEW